MENGGICIAGAGSDKPLQEYRLTRSQAIVLYPKIKIALGQFFSIKAIFGNKKDIRELETSDIEKVLTQLKTVSVKGHQTGIQLCLQALKLLRRFLQEYHCSERTAKIYLAHKARSLFDQPIAKVLIQGQNDLRRDPTLIRSPDYLAVIKKCVRYSFLTRDLTILYRLMKNLFEDVSFDSFHKKEYEFGKFYPKDIPRLLKLIEEGGETDLPIYILEYWIGIFNSALDHIQQNEATYQSFLDKFEEVKPPVLQKMN